ncbi:DHHA1 domain-containing protein [Bacillus sp. V59.32b]|uniref:alanyl-tRNA editing protein n=1 Tax=Bacillus sp. V59.32b TaxID=1758642 RepID=UPI000E3E8BFF|nr:DHHA1 domain-containing protein [Bacillus sp. V59.32b]RFU68251.1 alanyl-tRNA editing protein [Bacillus sp. V59.32b]
MWKKLFYEDAYLRKWVTSVNQVIEKDEFFLIVLEETAFYPEGGGQPSDSGSIDGIEVLDVLLEDDTIYHKLPKLPGTGEISCEIDWNRRFDHMQQHSGQHLLSAVCRELAGAKTMSFHLGSDVISIDIDATDLTQQQSNEIEVRANQLIFENRSIDSYFVSKEKLNELPVVKPPKVTENIRIVEIEGIEYNPCGGTHVKGTGSIGTIKILKLEQQKAFTRIYFKCGFRALAHYNESLEILNSLSTRFHTGHKDVISRIDKLEQDYRQAATEREKLFEENASYLIRDLLQENRDGIVSRLFNDKSLKELQYLAALLTKEQDLLALFGTRKDNKLVLSHNGSLPIHCGQFLKEHLASFNGKGGGNDKSAQAGFSSSEDLVDFLAFTKQQFLKEN